ncbi:MAG: trimeric intracellular cation channel family protein [Acidimicrobiales bacterium]
MQVLAVEAVRSNLGLDPSVEQLIDLLGIFVFAVSGGLTAVRKRFDVVGVIALAAITALGGGLLRDVLLGDTPPPALTEPAYLVAALVGAAATFVGHQHIERQWLRPHLVFDAAGLGLFCVAGTTKALAFGLNGVGAVALGVLTATGGGVMRDVLADEQPMLFRSETVLYGIPAALGATAVTIASNLELANAGVAGVVAVAVFAFRLAALHHGWHAPHPRGVDLAGDD